MTIIKNYSINLIIKFLNTLISENYFINLNNNNKLNNINYFDDLKLEMEIELLNEI